MRPVRGTRSRGTPLLEPGRPAIWPRTSSSPDPPPGQDEPGSSEMVALIEHLDAPLCGVQWQGSLAANETKKWFTLRWQATWHTLWTVMPTTVRPGAPEMWFDVQVEHADAEYVTYWITVKNLTSIPVDFDGRYAVLNWPGRAKQEPTCTSSSRSTSQPSQTMRRQPPPRSSQRRGELLPILLGAATGLLVRYLRRRPTPWPPPHNDGPVWSPHELLTTARASAAITARPSTTAVATTSDQVPQGPGRFIQPTLTIRAAKWASVRTRSRTRPAVTEMASSPVLIAAR